MGYKEIWGKVKYAQVRQIMGWRGYTESIPIFLTQHFAWSYSSVKAISGSSCFFFKVFVAISRKWVQIPQIMGWDIQKVIKILELHISHEMRSCSSVKGKWKSSYARFGVFRALGQFVKTGPKYPKSWTGTRREYSKVFSSTLYQQMSPYLRVETIWGSSYTLMYLDHYGNLGKPSPYPESWTRAHRK